MDRDLCKVWNVPNQNEYGKINGILVGVSNMVTFPTIKDVNVRASFNTPSKSVQLVGLQKKPWIFGRFQRKLVNESLGIFLSVQNSNANSGADSKHFLLKKSKEYRSVIQACLSDMNHYIETKEKSRPVPFSADVDSLKIDCQVLYKMELILGAVEFVFIESQPGSTVVGSLLNWIRLHFPECRRRLSEALSLEQPSSYKHYWDTIFGLVLQGLLVEARGLLKHHPSSNTDSFISMDEMLRKMPLHHAYTGVTEPEFGVRWQHWKAELQSRIDAGEFSDSYQLNVVAKIMSGDLETLVSLADILDTWYALMAATLLYANPTAKIHRLASAASEAISSFGMASAMSHLDELLLAVFQMDSHLVLKECQTVLNNLWFMCHLSDLFYHSREKSVTEKYLADIREFVLFDYGWELISHPSLWQAGLLYLDALGTPPSVSSQGQGGLSRLAVQAALESMPLESDAKALKVLKEASSRNMDEVAMGICRVMGRKRLRGGHLGSAIWWSIRSRDAAFSSHLAHKVLQKYMEDGEFVSSALLDHLGPSMELSDALTFLGKYREFHVLYQDGNIREASQLLVSLIGSRLAPEYFWPVLLEDALPLLQSPDTLIPADLTYKLISALHSVSLSADSEPKSTTTTKSASKVCSVLDEKEAAIRLALTNNLAKSIIQ